MYARLAPEPSQEVYVAAYHTWQLAERVLDEIYRRRVFAALDVDRKELIQHASLLGASIGGV